jgi:hypothetical protein
MRPTLKWTQRPEDGAIVITAFASSKDCVEELHFVNADDDPSSKTTLVLAADDRMELFGRLDVARVQKVEGPVEGPSGVHVKFVCPLWSPAATANAVVSEEVDEEGDVEEIEEIGAPSEDPAAPVATKWPRLLAAAGRSARISVDWSAYRPSPDDMSDVEDEQPNFMFGS